MGKPLKVVSNDLRGDIRKIEALLDQETVEELKQPRLAAVLRARQLTKGHKAFHLVPETTAEM
jgi:hypothetical protein